MTIQDFEKRHDTLVVNKAKNNTVLLTMKHEFLYGRYVRVYTIYYLKSFLGLKFWRTYSNLDYTKVFI